MRSEVIQEFRGKINDVEIDNKIVFQIVEFIVENLEEKFSMGLNENTVIEIRDAIVNMYDKSSEEKLYDIEQFIFKRMDECESIEDLKFNIYKKDAKIEISGGRIVR